MLYGIYKEKGSYFICNCLIFKRAASETRTRDPQLGELLDKDKFIQYGLTHTTIEWANGADLAPEFLHEIGTAA